jgi:tetratricopeptide (TPR) repeat protein
MDSSISPFDLALRKLNELTSLNEPSERDEIRRQYVMARLGQSNAGTPDFPNHVNASLLNEYALLYKAQNRLDKAKEFYSRALELAIEAGDLLAQAASYNNLGLIFFERKHYSKALEQFNQARRIYDTFQVAENTSYDLVQYAFIQRYKEETRSKIMSCRDCMGLPQSLEDLTDLLSLKRELNDQLGEARVLNLFGEYYFQKGKYCPFLESNTTSDEHSKIPGSACESYTLVQRCLNSFLAQTLITTADREISDVELLKAKLGLAKTSVVRGNYQDEMVNECNDIKQNCSDPLVQADALNLIGRIYLSRGALQDTLSEILSACDNSLKIPHQRNDRRSAIVLLNVKAQLHLALGEQSQAKSCYEEAFNISKQIPSLTGQIDSERGLGKIARSVDSLKEVLDRCKRHLHDPAREAYICCDLGEIYFEQKQCQESLDYYQAAQSISYEIGHSELSALSETGLARIYLYCGKSWQGSDSQEAYSYLEHASRKFELSYQFYKQIGNAAKQISLLIQLGETYRCQGSCKQDLGEYENAISLYSRAIEKYSTAKREPSLCSHIDLDLDAHISECKRRQAHAHLSISRVLRGS